jgi:4a-hydroxytetrahydrobiopterin dehydratase
MTALALQHCRAATGAALAASEVATLLAEVPDWTVIDGALQRPFEFNDYARLLCFVNAVGWLAQQQDHHPDLSITWGRCTVRWHTHSVAGLSINDFICAARVDALLP